MTAPSSEFYRSEWIETWALFDLRNPSAVDQLHRDRAVWQEEADLEALDEDHFVLIVRSAWVSEQAA